jgi:hypothetical protein
MTYLTCLTNPQISTGHVPSRRSILMCLTAAGRPRQPLPARPLAQRAYRPVAGVVVHLSNVLPHGDTFGSTGPRREFTNPEVGETSRSTYRRGKSACRTRESAARLPRVIAGRSDDRELLVTWRQLREYRAETAEVRGSAAASWRLGDPSVDAREVEGCCRELMLQVCLGGTVVARASQPHLPDTLRDRALDARADDGDL